MKVKQINVPYYKWKVITITIEDYKDKDEVNKKMHSLRMRDEDIENINNMIDGESSEGAVCHFNLSRLWAVIIVFPHKKVKDFVSTLVHEGRHAADEVIETVGLEGSESAAYLTEYIIFKMIEEYIKDEKP